MRFRHEQRYDAPPAEVHAMLADPVFREKVCQAQHATTVAVSIQAEGTTMVVLVDQTRPSDGIPAFAKKIVGEEIRIVQSEDWSDASHAALTVTIPGKPGELRGTVAIAGDGLGTVHRIDGDLKVAVPLLGGRLEALVAELLSDALVAERRVGSAWLAGSR